MCKHMRLQLQFFRSPLRVFKRSLRLVRSSLKSAPNPKSYRRCRCVFTLFCSPRAAVARQMVSERRAQTVLGAERGRDVRRGHVAVLRRQSDGVFGRPAVGRPVREHGTAAATGPAERDARLHAARGRRARYVPPREPNRFPKRRCMMCDALYDA